MSIHSMLNRSITLQRVTVTKDASGGQAREYSDVPGVEGIPAAIQPLSNDEKQAYAQRQIYQTHWIFVGSDIDARRKDRVVDDRGKVYVVEGFNDEGGRGEVWCIDVREQEE